MSRKAHQEKQTTVCIDVKVMEIGSREEVRTRGIDFKMNTGQVAEFVDTLDHGNSNSQVELDNVAGRVGRQAAGKNAAIINNGWKGKRFMVVATFETTGDVNTFTVLQLYSNNHDLVETDRHGVNVFNWDSVLNCNRVSQYMVRHDGTVEPTGAVNILASCSESDISSIIGKTESERGRVRHNLRPRDVLDKARNTPGGRVVTRSEDKHTVDMRTVSDMNSVESTSANLIGRNYLDETLQEGVRLVRNSRHHNGKVNKTSRYGSDGLMSTTPFIREMYMDFETTTNNNEVGRLNFAFGQFEDLYVNDYLADDIDVLYDEGDDFDSNDVRVSDGQFQEDVSSSSLEGILGAEISEMVSAVLLAKDMLGIGFIIVPGEDGTYEVDYIDDTATFVINNISEDDKADLVDDVLDSCGDVINEVLEEYGEYYAELMVYDGAFADTKVGIGDDVIAQSHSIFADGSYVGLIGDGSQLENTGAMVSRIMDKVDDSIGRFESGRDYERIGSRNGGGRTVGRGGGREVKRNGGGQRVNRNGGRTVRLSR